MGAYGSPELPPTRPSYPLRENVTETSHHGAWIGSHRRSAPMRVILWSFAVVAASFAMMIVAAIILGVIEAARATH